VASNLMRAPNHSSRRSRGSGTLLVEVKVSICEHRNPHINLTGFQTENSLNENPVSYPASFPCKLNIFRKRVRDAVTSK
jgi:hypothetical protein